jgi:hypothetical protein
LLDQGVENGPFPFHGGNVRLQLLHRERCSTGLRLESVVNFRPLLRFDAVVSPFIFSNFIPEKMNAAIA